MEAQNGFRPVPTKENGDTVKESSQDGGVNLKRKVNLVSGVTLIVGTMIGSGIFVSPKGVLQRSGSVALSLIVWAGCGVLSLFGALSYAELGTMIPKSGGEHAYLLVAFGPLLSYLYAWTLMLVMKPASVSIMALTFAQYIVDAAAGGCSSPETAKKLLAIICILTVTFINCFSVRLATRVQNLFTAAKLLAILIIVIAGVVKLAQGHTEHLATGFEGTTSSFSDVATAFYSGLWAYDGWNNLNFVTEELKNPYVNLPRAIWIGIPLVTICYVLVNVSYLTVMSSTELLSSDAVAVRFAFYALSYVAPSIPVFVALSAFGSTNGSLFAASRLAFVAAREGHTVEVLSHVHVRRFTPVLALFFNAVVAVCMIILGNIYSLIDFFSFTAWLFYGATVLAVIVLRRTRPRDSRPYKVPILIPIIVFLISVYLVVAPIIQQPQIEYLYAFLFVVSGLFFYIPFVHFKRRLSIMDGVTRFLQKLLEIVPPE